MSRIALLEPPYADQAGAPRFADFLPVTTPTNPYVRCSHPNTGGSMPKGYWVSVYRTISDPEKLAAYNKLASQAVGPAGGRTFVAGGRVVAHDAGIAERTVLVEFNSFEQAVAVYESAAYQKALVALSGGVERDFRIVEGTD